MDRLKSTPKTQMLNIARSPVWKYRGSATCMEGPPLRKETQERQRSASHEALVEWQGWEPTVSPEPELTTARISHPSVPIDASPLRCAQFPKHGIFGETPTVGSRAKQQTSNPRLEAEMGRSQGTRDTAVSKGSHRPGRGGQVQLSHEECEAK